MWIIRRSLSVSQKFSHFYKFVQHTNCTSNRIFYFTRFVSNSGCLIGGCCFSRQSDDETLLPKNNQNAPNSLTDYNSQSQSAIVRDVTMKRSCESQNEINFNVNSEQLTETCKKLKTEHLQIDSTVEVHPANASPLPTNGLPNTEDISSEVRKQDTTVEKPKRPNYFVAIKISDSQIIKTLKELQQHILDKDERLKKSMIQVATLHITLMVLYIGDTETHARALKTLKDIHQEHNDDFSNNPLKLQFKGLSHFQNRVLYAKLSADESYKRLNSLAESVKKHYSMASISSTDSKAGFTPHLTVLKIRDVRKKKKELPKKINPSLYKDFDDQYFGTQEVQSIQLLSMTDPKDEVGYYSGNEIYFSAFEPKARRDYLNKMLETEEKKKNVKDMINSLMKEKLK